MSAPWRRARVYLIDAGLGSDITSNLIASDRLGTLPSSSASRRFCADRAPPIQNALMTPGVMELSSRMSRFQE